MAIDLTLDLIPDLMEMSKKQDFSGGVDLIFQKLVKYEDVIFGSKSWAKNGVAASGTLFKFYNQIKKASDFNDSINAINEIPDELLSRNQKDIFVRQFQENAIFSITEAFDSGLTLFSRATPLTAEGYKNLSDLKSDLSAVGDVFRNPGNRRLAINMRKEKESMDITQKNINNLNKARANTMRNILIGVGKTVK